jgi:hypothetical protein
LSATPPTLPIQPLPTLDAFGFGKILNISFIRYGSGASNSCVAARGCVIIDTIETGTLYYWPYTTYTHHPPIPAFPATYGRCVTQNDFVPAYSLRPFLWALQLGAVLEHLEVYGHRQMFPRLLSARRYVSSQ